MIYDYSGTKTFAATLQIDDPGNCAIIAHGYYSIGKGAKFPSDYYLLIKTTMGKTTAIKWGPIDDLEALPSGFSLDVKTFGYKEASVNKEIQLFLNDATSFIYDAVPITHEEALDALPEKSKYVATLA